MNKLIVLFALVPSILFAEHSELVQNKEGQSGDALLNIQFNRDTHPTDLLRLQPADFLKLPTLQTVRHRNRWWEKDLAEVIKWETPGIITRGYITAIRRNETQWQHNNRRPTFLAISQSISAQPFITAIATDQYLLRRDITSEHLEALRDTGRLVQVSGRLVWDNAYTEQWYLVITKIEFLQHGLYKEF